MIRRLALLSFLLAGTLARAAAPAGWKLVWSGEFDQPGAPDPAQPKAEN